MSIDRSSREWMQALARLRTKAARLRSAARPETAEVLETLDAALDLTDAMRAECANLQQRNAELQQLAREHEEETRRLIDALPHAVIQTDCAGLVLEANHAGAALLGLSQAKLKNELLLYFSEDRAAFADLVRGLPRDSQAVRARARLRPRDRAPFQASISVLRDPRSSDQRWLWFLDRITVAQTPAGTPFQAASVLSPSERCEMQSARPHRERAPA